MTEYNIPSTKATLSGKGFISSGVVFLHASRLYEGQNHQILKALRLRDKHWFNLAFAPAHSINDMRMIGGKYFPSMGRLVAGLTTNDGYAKIASFQIGGNSLEISETHSIMMRASTSPESNTATLAFRMVRRTIFCFLAMSPSKIAVIANIRNEFHLVKTHQLKTKRIFTYPIGNSSEASFYAYKLLASGCQQSNLYQIYRLQLKF